MCGGGDRRARAEADRARAEEEARQARIRAGTESVNRLFDATFYGTGPGVPGNGAAAPAAPPAVETLPGMVDPRAVRAAQRKLDSVGGSRNKQRLEAAQRGTPATYKVGTRMFATLPEAQTYASSPEAAAEAAKANPAAAPAAPAASTPAGPPESYFDRIAQSYVDFARPQVEEQLGKAREGLTYSLARSGILDSSVRTEKNADLQRAADREFMNVADKGREYATQARKAVEDARAGLITTLNATADNTGAANAAINRAEALTSQPSYSPVGQLFTDFTAGLETQAALERAAALGYGPQPRVRTGLFGAPSSAVKTTR